MRVAPPVELTEDQVALREMAHDFAANEMRPKAAAYDQGHTFPEDVMHKAFEVGFLTCTVPAEYGGVGLGDQGIEQPLEIQLAPVGDVPPMANGGQMNDGVDILGGEEVVE